MEGLVKVLIVEQGHWCQGACWATRCGGLAIWKSGSLGVPSQHKSAIQSHFLSTATLPPLDELIFWFYMISHLAGLHSIFMFSYSIYILYLWYIIANGKKRTRSRLGVYLASACGEGQCMWGVIMVGVGILPLGTEYCSWHASGGHCGMGSSECGRHWALCPWDGTSLTSDPHPHHAMQI